MTTHSMNPIRSEKGVALIIVLLLLAVMAGLTTGLTLNGQTEIAMAANETYYAGARAAAEAGLNRATEQIIGDTVLDLITTKAVPVIGNGPIALNADYSYSFELLDDDDPALYIDPLTGPGPGTQLTAMNENGNANLDQNSRMILRATATGPHGTSVTVARVLSRFTIPAIPAMNINPAILVNGDLNLTGNMHVQGLQGNVHANGSIIGGGSATVTGNITATGTVADDLDPDGLKAGGMPIFPIPEIKASDYFGLATYVLTSGGVIQVKNAAGAWVNCSGKGITACPSGWTPPTGPGAPWTADGSMPTTPTGAAATYYVQGPAEVHGTGKSVLTAISIIAEGSLKINGNGQFKPGNTSKIQFVTNGDFEMLGNADADDPTNMDGQIMVREQMKILGNSEFQGRVMVENRSSASNAYNAATNPNGRKGTSSFDTNDAQGNMTVTYNGQLGGIDVPGGPLTYTNIISGWMEQQ